MRKSNRIIQIQIPPQKRTYFLFRWFLALWARRRDAPGAGDLERDAPFLPFFFFFCLSASSFRCPRAVEAAGPPITGVLPVHDICFVAIGRLLFACSLHTMSDPVDKKEQVLRVDTYFTYFPVIPGPSSQQLDGR